MDSRKGLWVSQRKIQLLLLEQQEGEKQESF